jgi:K+-sensing histidine kinase KdpD
MDKEIFSKLVLYPFIYKSERFDSIHLAQNKTCLKNCKDQYCSTFLNETAKESYFRCKMGFDNFRIILSNNEYILNGLILTDNKVIPTGRKEVRKEYIVRKTIFESHINYLKDLNEIISKKILENIEENISVFHDVKTSVGIVTACSEGLINANIGRDFNEKLNNSSHTLRDLYDAVDLVNSQLGMIDIIVNTQSITYGNKKSINIFQLFHRVAKLFIHRADKKNIKIQWHDDGKIPDIKCYEFIEFIPIILLDNAIKYSEPSTTIKIFFNVTIDSVIVAVSSYGPIVKKEFRKSIFDKYVRGENAKNYCKEGIGVGLWICRKVLEAHDTGIIYNYEQINNSLGFNKFEFEIYKK